MLKKLFIYLCSVKSDNLWDHYGGNYYQFSKQNCGFPSNCQIYFGTFILVAIFNIKNVVTSDTFDSVSLSLNYLQKRCLLNMILLNAFQCIKIKTDGLGH